MRPAALALLVAAGCTVLMACSREETDDTVEASGGQEMQLTDAGRDRTVRPPSPDSGPPVPVLPSLDPRETAFSETLLESSPIYPADFRLGSLRPIGLSMEDSRAWEYAARVLNELSIGTYEPTGAPESPALGAAMELVRGSASEFGLVRVARPVPGVSGERFFPFRLPGADTELLGELVVESADGGWYIADMQVARVQRDRTAEFDPAAPWR